MDSGNVKKVQLKEMIIVILAVASFVWMVRGEWSDLKNQVDANTEKSHTHKADEHKAASYDQELH